MSQSSVAVRRVVARVDEEGVSRVWSDGQARNAKHPTPLITSTLLWATEGAPAPYLVNEDAGDWQLGTAPPPGGTRFVSFVVQPGQAADRMHATDTVDYVICVSGSLDLRLETETVTLGPGDVAVQLGTAHALGNSGDVPAVAAIVLVDGRPKRPSSVTEAMAPEGS